MHSRSALGITVLLLSMPEAGCEAPVESEPKIGWARQAIGNVDYCLPGATTDLNPDPNGAPLSEVLNLTIDKVPVSTGQLCSTSTDCTLGGTCTDGRCANSSCSTSADCTQGGFCNAGQCRNMSFCWNPTTEPCAAGYDVIGALDDTNGNECAVNPDGSLVDPACRNWNTVGRVGLTTCWEGNPYPNLAPGAASYFLVISRGVGDVPKARGWWGNYSK
jgi:hypothetical protein